MRDDQPPMVNFSIASSAKKELEVPCRAYEEHANAEADVVMIGWGEYRMNDGRQFGDVIVSFYEKDQRADIKDGIQLVDGVEVLFFTTRSLSKNFAGKTLVHESGRFQLV
jgi:hypothetical protein